MTDSWECFPNPHVSRTRLIGGRARCDGDPSACIAKGTRGHSAWDYVCNPVADTTRRRESEGRGRRQSLDIYTSVVTTTVTNDF